MWISILVVILGVALAGFCAWGMRKNERNQARREINDTLDEIAGDKMMLSVVRSMVKNNGVSVDEIIKMTGNELTARVVIDRLRNVGVLLGMFSVPVTYQKGSKLFIVPRWLRVFQELEKWNWDSSRVYELKF